eukprot:1143796-Pelagomonas_calceolata.AAC.3
MSVDRDARKRKKTEQNRTEQNRKGDASQVQLRALRKGFLTSKLARASQKRGCNTRWHSGAFKS